MSEQNFVGALIFGAAATILAAGFYGVIGSSGTMYSFWAAGIGLAIGFTMQYLGRGIESKFSIVAAVFGVAGCLLGNMFAVAIYVARANTVSPFTVLRSTPLSELGSWMVSDLQLVDLIFWLAAAGAAAYFAPRRLSREERLAIGMYSLRN